jgi:hypothetical protein
MTLHEKQSRLGRMFESEFERQAVARGYHVVRHCDQLGIHGTKAPMLSGPYKGYRLPDFSILVDGSMPWVEAKYKSYSPYFAKERNQRHGIDLPNWGDYLKVCQLSGQPGYLILGVGSTGDIIKAPFKLLEKFAQIHNTPTPKFPNGGVFWPARIFRPWGRLDALTGQMCFDFGEGFGFGIANDEVA